MNKTSFSVLALAVGLLSLAGCASGPTYVDAKGQNLIVEVDKINIQDFDSAANEMVASLIEKIVANDKLKSSSPTEPALMAISRIKNSTGSQLETDLLIKKIRVQLLGTGKVQATTTMNLGGAEDPLAKENQAAEEFRDDKKHTRLPDYTLSGNIIEDRSKAGKVRQSAFVFQLSLSSRAGIAIWEDERTIAKQGKRPSVGY